MRKLMMLGTLMLSSFLVFAQKNYAVMVSDAKTANPVAGASIKILSTGATITTSPSGNVVLFVSPDDSLLITAKGYKDRKLMMVNQFVALTVILDPVSKEKVAVKPKTKKPQRKQ